MNKFDETLKELKSDYSKIAFLRGYIYALEGNLVNVHNQYGFLFTKERNIHDNTIKDMIKSFLENQKRDVL